MEESTAAEKQDIFIECQNVGIRCRKKASGVEEKNIEKKKEDRHAISHNIQSLDVDDQVSWRKRVLLAHKGHKYNKTHPALRSEGDSVN